MRHAMLWIKKEAKMIKNNYLVLLLLLTLSLHASVTRVMPLGDSITYDDSYADYGGYSRPASVRHAYRNYLWYRLRDARYQADFVGSRIAGTAITPHFDPENEGWPGQTSDYIANIVYGKLVQNPADIILLHIGTNDRWRIDSSGNYMSGMQRIFSEVDRFERNYHHHVKIIVALIIGRRYNDYASFTNTFNANLNALAHQRISQGDDIVIIDMQHNAGLNYASDFRDPAHPTTTGYSKMANLWYNALRPYLDIAPLPKPTAPTRFTDAQLSAHQVTLSWSDNANNEIGYKIYQNNVLIATLPANSTSYTITNLESRSTYTYRLTAYNNEGNSNMLSLTIHTKDDYAWLPSIYHINLY